MAESHSIPTARNNTPNIFAVLDLFSIVPSSLYYTIILRCWKIDNSLINNQEKMIIF